MFDTLITVTEHLYAEYMFAEQEFRVKDPVAEPGCHTPSSDLEP